MSFVMTEEWLRLYYGSRGPQVAETTRWLQENGVLERHAGKRTFPEAKIPLYAQYKHLSEYQPNCYDIVERCLARVGYEFESELWAHRWVNIQRFNVHADSYVLALEEVQPKTILELGVGGDSAISTAVFLAHIEKVGGHMISVDCNPLGMTWERYGKYPFWTFIQRKSEDVIREFSGQGKRFDMVFIDTMPTYSQTKIEMEVCHRMSDNLLLDDASRLGEEHDNEGGKILAKEQFIEANPDWELVEYGPFTKATRDYDVGNVALVRKKDVPKKKLIQPKKKLLRRR